MLSDTHSSRIKQQFRKFNAHILKTATTKTTTITRITHIEVISMCGVGEQRVSMNVIECEHKRCDDNTNRTANGATTHYSIFYQIALSFNSHLSRLCVFLWKFFSSLSLSFSLILLNSHLKKHIVSCVSISFRCHFIRAPLYRSLFTLFSVFKTHTTIFLPCF